jgi:hypothetical protein
MVRRGTSGVMGALRWCEPVAAIVGGGDERGDGRVQMVRADRSVIVRVSEREHVPVGGDHVVAVAGCGRDRSDDRFVQSATAEVSVEGDVAVPEHSTKGREQPVAATVRRRRHAGVALQKHSTRRAWNDAGAQPRRLHAVGNSAAFGAGFGGYDPAHGSWRDFFDAFTETMLGDCTRGCDPPDDQATRVRTSVRGVTPMLEAPDVGWCHGPPVRASAVGTSPRT